MANLGRHLAQLQEQVNESGQSTEAHQHSIQKLSQQIYDLQSRLIAEIARQSACQHSQAQALSLRIDDMSIRYSESEHRHATSASDRLRYQEELDQVRKALEQYHQQTELDRFRNERELAQANLEALADRIESRLTLIEAALEISQPITDSLPTRLDAIDRRFEATDEQIIVLNSKMEQQQQYLLSKPVAQPSESIPKESRREQALKAAGRLQAAIPQTKSRFCPTSYNLYSRMDTSAPFVYLDVKSVPRSGLHYLQRNLQSILGKHMSFCEWYQEPGCCKQMPCAITGFAQSCCQQGLAHLRMIKSHDFDLADPIFPTCHGLRRVLLIRDPIYSLTSYWNLQALTHNQELLKGNGINPMKIDYLHERPVLQMAYSLIDSHGTVPSEKTLIQWLEKIKRYMLGFISKWGRHVPRESIIRYEHVDKLVEQIVEDLPATFPTEVTDRLAEWRDGRKDRFRPRANPFFSLSDRLSQHLKQHAELFERFSAEIKEEDPTGCFASCGQEASEEISSEKLPREAETRTTPAPIEAATNLIPFGPTANQWPAA
jgi:hypothetical protein